MAKATMSLDVQITKYRLVFFPVATYTKVGDSEELTIFGISVYKRAGCAREILGFQPTGRAPYSPPRSK